MTHVLIVEDQPPVARLLQRWVDEVGAHAVVATSAEQALLLAAQHVPAVALCDVHLPGGRDGFWFLEQLRTCHPATVAVVTTGDHAFDAAVAGLRAGITDYVLKPYTRARITEVLGRALVEHTARQKALADRFAHAGASSTSDTKTHTTAALLTVLYADNDVVARQAQRVSRLAARLAEALDIDDSQVADVEHAALLHYVRRLDIYSMARRMPCLAAASGIAVAVEERFDGSGFPLGLRGDAIPFGARIVAAAAAYDQLTLGDALIDGVGPDRAIETLCGAPAAQFDPAVLRAFRAVTADLQTTAG